MKKMYRKMYADRAAVLGYGKKYTVRKGLKESIHMASMPQPGRLGFNRDPELATDPAQIKGIEIGDTVAFAATPDEPLGVLAGITGFREAIVQTDAGLHEFKKEAIVKYEDSGDL